MDQEIGRLEQAGNVVAAAQPVDFVSQRGTLGDLPHEPATLRAVASERQVPVGPLGDHALGRVQKVGQSLLKVDPADSAGRFNLANLLRAGGRTVEAEALYREAVKANPDFAEAWYNLADVLDDQRRTPEAVECLARALAADPAYADALFNMGLFMQRLERHADAATWWRRYLALDDSSPWAARAKRALKYCEMQLAGSMDART